MTGKKKKTIPSVGEVEKQPEHSDTARGNINWYSHLGKLTVCTIVEHTYAYPVPQ